MASNEDEEIDLDLDTDDDLGLDLDMDFGEAEAVPPPKNTREAVEHSLKDGAKGFTEGLTDDKLETAATIAKSAIPSSLSKESDIVVGMSDTIKDEISKAGGEVRKQASSTFNVMKKFIPQNNEKINNAVDKISMMLGGDESSSSKGPSEAEIRAENIKSELQNALGEQQEASAREDLIKEQLAANRNKSQVDLLANTAINTERLRKFNYEVTNNYYRKSLELQFESLYVTKDQLVATRTGFETFKNQLESIVTNTALPETVKVRNSERFKDSIKARSTEMMTDMFYSDANPLTRFKKNFAAKVGEVKDGVLSGLQGAESAASALEGMEGTGMSTASMAGSMGADYVKDLFGKTIGKQLEKNEYAKGKIADIKGFTGDISGGFRTMGKREGLVGKLGNFMADMTDDKKQSTYSMEKKDLNDISLFDNRAHNSIVKIIPGLLSKIYGELKSTRLKDNDPSSNEVIYDNKTEKFVTKKVLKENLKHSIKRTVEKGPGQAIQQIVLILQSPVNYLKPEYALRMTPSEQTVFRTALLDYMFNKGSTSYKGLSTGKFLNRLDNEDLKDRVTKALKYLVLFTKHEKGDTKILDRIHSLLTAIKVGIPSLKKEMDELNASGYADLGEELGILKTNKMTGVTSLNKEGLGNIVKNNVKNMNTDKLNADIEEANYKAREKVYLKAMPKKKRGDFNSLEEKDRRAKVRENTNEDGTLKDKPQFAKGGYTGDGAKYEKAGDVHKREYVFSREKVDELLSALGKVDVKGIKTQLNTMATDIQQKSKDVNIKNTAKEAKKALLGSQAGRLVGDKLTQAKNSKAGLFANDKYSEIKMGTDLLLADMKKSSDKLQGYVKTNYETIFKGLQDTNKNVTESLGSIYDSSSKMLTDSFDKVKGFGTGVKNIYNEKGAKGIKDQFLKEGKSFYSDKKEDILRGIELYQEEFKNGTLSKEASKHYKSLIKKANKNKWLSELTDGRKRGKYTRKLKKGLTTIKDKAEDATDKLNTVASDSKEKIETFIDDSVVKLVSTLPKNKQQIFKNDYDKYKKKTPKSAQMTYEEFISMYGIKTLKGLAGNEANQAVKAAKEHLKYANNTLKDNFNIVKNKVLGGFQDEFEGVEFIANYVDYTPEEQQALKIEFFSSAEFKDGIFKDFDKWLAFSKQIKPEEKKSKMNDLLKNLKTKFKPLTDLKNKFNNAKQELIEDMMGKLTGTGLKELTMDQESAMRKEFFNSEEYKDKLVTDFDIWLKSYGYKKSGKGMLSKFLNNFKLKNVLDKTRSLDKKIFKGAAELVGKGITGTAKGIVKAPIEITKATGRGLYNAGRVAVGLNKIAPKVKVNKDGSLAGKAAGGALGLAGKLASGTIGAGVGLGAAALSGPLSLLGLGAGEDIGEGGVKSIKAMLTPNTDKLPVYNTKIKRAFNNKFKDKNTEASKEAEDSHDSKWYRKYNPLADTLQEKRDKVEDAKVTSPSGVDKLISFFKKEDADKTLKEHAKEVHDEKIRIAKEKLEAKEKIKEKSENRFLSHFSKDSIKSKVGNAKDKTKAFLGNVKDKAKSFLTPTTILLGIGAAMKAMGVTMDDVKGAFGVVKNVLGSIWDTLKWGFNKLVTGFRYIKTIPDALEIALMKMNPLSSDSKIAEKEKQLAAKRDGTYDEKYTESGKKQLSTKEIIEYEEKHGKGSYQREYLAGDKIDEGHSAKEYAIAAGGTAIAGHLIKKATLGIVNPNKLIGKAAEATTKLGVKAAKTGIKNTPKIKKAGMLKKVKAFLSKIKKMILKKVGKKAGDKLLAKIASRFIPFVGAAILAYDVAMVIKYMVSDKMDFKGAVSKAVIGFNIFDDSDTPVDENGDPIKPDKDLIKTKVVEDTKKDIYSKKVDSKPKDKKAIAIANAKKALKPKDDKSITGSVAKAISKVIAISNENYKVMKAGDTDRSKLKSYSLAIHSINNLLKEINKKDYDFTDSDDIEEVVSVYGKDYKLLTQGDLKKLILGAIANDKAEINKIRSKSKRAKDKIVQNKTNALYSVNKSDNNIVGEVKDSIKNFFSTAGDKAKEAYSDFKTSIIDKYKSAKSFLFGGESAEAKGDGPKVKDQSGGKTGKLVKAKGPLTAPDGGFKNLYANGKDVDLTGFNPAFAKNLASMANEYNTITGNKIPINSGYRSFEHQAALKKKDPKHTASPGHSPHNFGLAFDTNTNIAEKLDSLGLMRKYGFTRPVGGETWHVEAIGPSLDIAKSKKDPSLATDLITKSVGRGGTGWGAGGKGENNNHGRNVKVQKSIMESSASAPKLPSVADTVSMGSGKKSTLGKAIMKHTDSKLDKTATAGSKPSINPKASKPGSTDIADRATKVVKVPVVKPVDPQQQKIIDTTNQSAKIAEEGNKHLKATSDNTRQMVDLQRQMVDILSNVHTAVKEKPDNSKSKETTEENNTLPHKHVPDMGSIKTPMPNPAMDLKRKTYS